MWPRVTTVCRSGTGLDIQTGLWIRIFSVQPEDGPELKPRHRAHPKAGLLKIPAWSPVPWLRSVDVPAAPAVPHAAGDPLTAHKVGANGAEEAG